jgi:hypothetical protein
VTEHRLEVADVFRQHEQEFLKRWGHSVSTQQLLAFRDICACRTAALGAHVEQCDGCSRQIIAYDSCRNRHCPKCQTTARDKWLAARTAELLPVPYCHMVFTLPQELSTIALQNPRLIYGILFRAVSETLLTIAADPRHLGAHIGFLAVLHTWNQKMLPHPHLHCLIPAGGISLNRSRWVRCRPRFCLPVKVLRKMFRGKFLPSGFVKIRHFGFLANRNRRQALQLCRSFLPAPPDLASTLFTEAQPRAMERKCPFCHTGTLHILDRIPAQELAAWRLLIPADTS